MSSPPILLLHGMFSTPKLLAGWVSLLESAGYRVHAPAYPGHDPVDMAVLSRVTLSDYIAAALAAYDELDETPIVIGHSIGGLVAQHVAAARERGVGAAGAGASGCVVASAALVASPVPDNGKPHQGPAGETVGENISRGPAVGTARCRATGSHRRIRPRFCARVPLDELGQPRHSRRSARCALPGVVRQRRGRSKRRHVDLTSHRAPVFGSAAPPPDLPHWIVANSALPQVAPPVMAWLEARVTESVS